MTEPTIPNPVDAHPPTREELEALTARVTALEQHVQTQCRHARDASIEQRAAWARQVDAAVCARRDAGQVRFEPPASVAA